MPNWSNMSEQEKYYFRQNNDRANEDFLGWTILGIPVLVLLVFLI